MRTAVLGLVLLCGCSYYQPAMVSTASLGPREKPLAVVMGESQASYFFFFGPFGNNSLAMAVEDAKKQTGADSLMNVFVDRKTLLFPLPFLPILITNKTLVYGTAVKYDENLQNVTIRERAW